MAFIKLMEYEWSDNPREVEYLVPDTWNITTYHIKGYRKSVLTPEQIRNSIASPVGSPRIRDLCQGKKKVCILFDDLSRGTPVADVIPHILEELHSGSIKDNQIEFICALGAHQAFDRSVLAKKLGQDIIASYPVFNHNPFMNCTYLGTTSFGTRVEINSEVMSCDLKIAIGGVVPHPSFGFGGGGKIVMPGISSFDSIVEHHSLKHQDYARSMQRIQDAKGIYDNNPFPKDAIEFAKMAGIDFSINCLLNEKAELVDIYAGNIEASFRLAVNTAREHYLVPNNRDNDIVIANAYCKANEAILAAQTAFHAVTPAGGTTVVIANSHLGQVMHYLSGSWGVQDSRPLVLQNSIPKWINHCIFYSEFPEGRNKLIWSDNDLPKVIFPHNWNEVVNKLIEWHGNSAKVAVFPDATNQYSIQPEYQ